MAKKKKARKKKAVARKAAPKKRAAAKKKAPRKKKKFVRRGRQSSSVLVPGDRRGLGAASAGQAGDLQGISRRHEVDDESEEELLEEGQSFEAAAVRGVEEADDADEAEVTTHEVLEDDVPEEYDDRDK